MKVAVIGSTGWVGRSMIQLFPDAYVYTSKIGTKEEVNKAGVVFICVPSPLLKNGTLDTSIVEDIVSWCECPLIVIRSTVSPGTTASLSERYKKRIVMQPEYLGETPSHPMLDPKTRPFLVIGGEPEDRRKLIDLYTTVYNANVTIRQVTALEAEVIKLSENRAIAFKVIQCQELYDVCEKAGVDYYTVRDAVYGDDPRFNLWFTFVYPDNRGFQSSKCLKKDVPAWYAWAESVGIYAEATKVLIEKSKNYETYNYLHNYHKGKGE
jgi:UDPglucose 6-dehydrogenase